MQVLGDVIAAVLLVLVLRKLFFKPAKGIVHQAEHVWEDLELHDKETKQQNQKGGKK